MLNSQLITYLYAKFPANQKAENNKDQAINSFTINQ